MLANFDGLVWLAVLLAPLLFVQRRVHGEIQAVFLLLTRRAEIALVLFSLLFLPGVLLHEMSHFLMAAILRVDIGRFSLAPRYLPDGRLQLGFVETAQADVVRDALVGLAPLLSGSAFVIFGGLQLGLMSVWENLAPLNAAGLWDALASLPGQPDFWLWFYLTFTVSSTMLPSAADRRAWLPILLSAAGLLLLAALAGAGGWLMANLAPPFNRGLHTLDAALGITLALHVALWGPVWGARKLLSRVTGLQIAVL